MRLPRSLRRFLDPHTSLITGVKTALRAGNGQQMRSLIHSAHRRLGLSSVQADLLSDTLVGRLDDSVSHSDASNQLTELARAIPHARLSAQSWLTLENLSRTVGCFLASASFTEATRMRMRAGSDQEVFLAHLHDRDPESAIRQWSNRSSTDHQSGFWADAGHYLWWWTRGEAGVFRATTDERFSGEVSGHPVVVMGPAPSTLTSADVPAGSLVARVIMQEVLSWNPTTDALAGACDLAYASRETRNWIRDTDSWFELQPFRVVSFRLDGKDGDFPAAPSYLRHAHDPRSLMPGGSSPNMIPLMLWDLSRVPGVDLTLAGTTFFASRTAYTEGNRRLKHTTGKDTDETGSTGQLFERCPTFARHNVTENLTLVANLIQSGAIQADSATREITELSIGDYLRTLDELYGKQRR